MATNTRPIKPSTDPNLVIERFQSGDAVSPDYGGTGLTNTELAGNVGKLLAVNATADGYTLTTGGGGGGGSIGTGFTSGGGSGTIPSGTNATLNGQLRFLQNYPNGDIRFDVPVDFNNQFNVDADAVFAGYTFFSGSVGFNGGISSVFVVNGGANGTSGIIFDVTEAAEHTDIKVNDVVRVSITPDGSLNMPTTTGAFIPPRLTESERNATTPDIGWTIYCTDATADDTSTGVMQTYNGSTWKNHW